MRKYLFKLYKKSLSAGKTTEAVSTKVTEAPTTTPEITTICEQENIMRDRLRVPLGSVSTSPDIADLDTILNPENQGSVPLIENQLTITIDVTADYTEVEITGNSIQIMSVSYIPKGELTLETVVCFILFSQSLLKSMNILVTM